MLRDKLSHFEHELHWAKTVSSDETPSSGVDLQGYSAATVLVSIGALADSGGSPLENWEFKIQESDTSNSGFSEVDEDDLLLEYGKNDGSVSSGVFATVDANEDELDENQNLTVGYIGSKRYIKIDAVANNSPGNTPIAVSVIKEALQKPQAD